MSKSRKLKKLPIGIQSISEIINGDYVYVDKTHLIFSLITEGKYYFFSRPRRFGKSLLIDTFKNIFIGNRLLFKKTAIDSFPYEWKSHPIIHLDFSLIPHDTPEILYAALERRLKAIAAEYNVSITIPTLEEGLIDLVKKISIEKKEQIVVLIDEYDKPLIDHVDHLEIARKNRTLLRNLFSVLKGLDEKLRFVFITGVSKFSHVSLFSGLNNLEDITISPKYAELAGYTEKEISHFFKEHISYLAHQQKKTSKQILNLMRHWYNGYKFSKKETAVYNPFSTMLYLKEGRIETYWFATATPTFLIHQIKKFSYPLDQITDIEAGDEIFNIHDVDKMNLISLMWQTGYLTIKAYNPSSRLYHLDYPNEEVRVSFIKHLAESMTGMMMTQVTTYPRELISALNGQNLELFFQYLETFFSHIPYELHISQEKYYQSIFYILGKLLGLDTEAEVRTNLGRIDMVISLAKVTYILEFKIDSSADKALQQINKRKYYQKYLKLKKKTILVGANFDTKKRNISDWKSMMIE